MFETLLIFGAAGFLVMTLLGLSHGHSHAGGGHGHSHAGHGIGHSHGTDALGSADSSASLVHHHDVHAATLQAPVARAAGVRATLAKSMVAKGLVKGGASHGGGLAQQAKGIALMLISPLDIFSVCLGTGMAGILLTHFAPGLVYLLPAAILCGVVFDLALTRSLLRLALKFAAEPSEGLEGMVMHCAKATTAFGADGKGVVEMILDGQSSQVLATLDPEEVQSGVRVRKGDSLLVLEVDPHRNVCRVSKDLAPTEPPKGAQA